MSIAAIVAACAVTFRYHDPAKPHRAGESFRNNYPHAEKGGFWRWKWDQLREGVPRDPEDGYRFAGRAEPSRQSFGNLGGARHRAAARGRAQCPDRSALL